MDILIYEYVINNINKNKSEFNWGRRSNEKS